MVDQVEEALILTVQENEWHRLGSLDSEQYIDFHKLLTRPGGAVWT
jgi:hypothetical protein